MELENEQNIVTDILTDLINDISYPPVSPTLTKDLLVEKLKEAKEIIENVVFTDGENGCSGIDSTDLVDLRDDIDEAQDRIDYMNKFIEEDFEGLKDQGHREKFMEHFNALKLDLKHARGELDWMI